MQQGAAVSAVDGDGIVVVDGGADDDWVVPVSEALIDSGGGSQGAGLDVR